MQFFLWEHFCQQGVGARAENFFGVSEEEIVVLVHKPSDVVHYITSIVPQLELLREVGGLEQLIRSLATHA